MTQGAGGQQNPLQRLVQEWLDAEPGRSLGDLAAKVHVPRNTFYALHGRTDPDGMPTKDTLKALARALEVPYRRVVAAAVEAAYKVEVGETTKNPNVEAIVAHVENRPEEVQRHMLRLLRTFQDDLDQT